MNIVLADDLVEGDWELGAESHMFISHRFIHIIHLPELPIHVFELIGRDAVIDLLDLLRRNWAGRRAISQLASISMANPVLRGESS